MSRINIRTVLLGLGLVLVTLAAYANHFQNGFHFDDAHTIVENPFIRSVRNVPRFFADASLFSSDPGGQVYRPVLSTSLAIDYRLGRGYKLFYFHLSTFLWFAVQLILMWFLFRRIMDRADAHPSNLWTALAAAACYGLHPANAETVNYIVQRADLYTTLGVVASLLCFAAYPGQRKYGWYLLPAIAAYLSKASALIFPLILLAYVFLIEQEGTLGFSRPPAEAPGGRGENRKKWIAALRAALPALAVTLAAAIFTARMTPSAYHGGAVSGWLYRLTQPWVALHYFKSFFLPTDLSADSGWTYVSGPFSGEALAGYLFVAALLTVAVLASRSRQARPISFGILWFFLALLPTSLMPLADVTNDHRMFFPFVGLALGVFWSLRLWLFRKTERLTTNPLWVRGALAALVVVAALELAGTYSRNQVWHTEESLWQDVTLKSPGNARGLMNYGLVFLARHQYSTAIPYLERARQLEPNYGPVEANLGVAYGRLERDAEARQHFERALALAPDLAEPHIFYGRWLEEKGRLAESQAQLVAALKINRYSFLARDLLGQVYTKQGNRQALDRLLEETVRLTFNDDVARRYMAERAEREKRATAAKYAPGTTPEEILNLSAKYCNTGAYADCLEAAKNALELRPDYAEAYNNMAAAWLALEQWDEGIEAARQALRLQPNYAAAKDNLAWGLAHRPKARN